MTLSDASRDNPGFEGSDESEIRIADAKTGDRDETPAENAQTESCDFEAAIAETGYGRFNVLLLLASIPGLFGCINTTSTISLILPSAECDLDLSNFDKGMMNAVSYIGMISCAFVWGFLSDTLGRKKLLVIAFFLDFLLSVTVALAQTFAFFITAKLFSGFISAGPYAILMAYLAECHASKYRASIIVWTGIFSSIATICLPGVAWLIVPQPLRFDILGGRISLPSWRIFLLVSAIPSLIASALLSMFGESPRFLMTRGRREEAMDVFKTMYAINTGKPRDTYPVKSLKKEDQPESEGDDERFAFLRKGCSQITPLFHKPYVFNAVLTLVIQLGTLAGLNTMRLWAPQLFSTMMDREKAIGADDDAPTTICQLLDIVSVVNTTQITDVIQCVPRFVETRVYINSMIIGGISSAGYLCSGYLVRFMGKKLLIIMMYAIAGLCCLAMYWSNTTDIMLGLTSVFITMTSISATTIVTVVVDLFPTALRTMAVSLTMMSGRFGAMVGNLTFPVLLEWNCSVLFFVIAALTFGSGALSMLLPKTKGAALK